MTASEQAAVLARAVEAGAFDYDPDEVVTADGALRRVEEFLGGSLLPSVVAKVRALLDVRFRNVPRGKSWRVLLTAEDLRRDVAGRRRYRPRSAP